VREAGLTVTVVGQFTVAVRAGRVGRDREPGMVCSAGVDRGRSIDYRS